MNKLLISTILLLLSSLFLICDPVIAETSPYFLAQVNNNNATLGREIYLEECTSCHIPIPPQVLPRESWQNILTTPQNHYGKTLPKIINLKTVLIWSYLKTFSRPSIEGETIPELVTNSRYFKALHPDVILPVPSTHQSCKLCHPSADGLNYRLANKSKL